MTYKDLEKLPRDSEQSGLFDMFTSVFFNNITIEVFGYVIRKEDEMRIDKVCQKIYGNMDNVSFLCNLNNIKNPLSVKSGSIILYVNENLIQNFNPPAETVDQVRLQLLNNNKAKKTDQKRKEINIPQQDPLPTTIKKQTKPNIIVDDQKEEIILGPQSASERPVSKPSTE